jgi:NTE family protein
MTPELLSTIPFLKSVGSFALRDIAKSSDWYCVPSGSPLYLDTEPAETIWFVLSGSMAAFRKGSDGKPDFIGHIRQGEPVGEFALLAGEPHSGSVFALRDSEVVAINRATFNRLVRRHPELMSNLARTVLFRSRINRRKNPRSEPRVFALLNASPTIDMKGRALALRDALARIGKKTLIVGVEARDFNGSWFDDAERTHDVVLLISETHQDSWANLCQRRADRTWIFGRADTPPTFSGNTRLQRSAYDLRLTDVVLARASGAAARTCAADWIASTNAQRVFYWRDGEVGHVDRLARVIAGTSLGLVLGGGGARAYAHIGAVRALREAGHRFDFVGGTSMGGVIAACVAIGWDDSEIERRIWDAFVRNSPLDDFVLPVVSLTAGRKVDARLKEHFGEVLIEDLETPFFCVSTNLTLGVSKIHDEGCLRHALLASIALPGILPPVVWGDDVLVDGAVLDNFPVATMRERHRGNNVGIDVAQQHSLNPDNFRLREGFFKWVLRHGFKSAPPIAELLMRSATANVPPVSPNSSPEFLIVPELAGIELRDWKSFDKAVEAGYNATTRALQLAPPSLRLG